MGDVPVAEIPDRVRLGGDAFRNTFVHELSAEVSEELLAGSAILNVPAGALVFDLGDPRPHMGLMLSGTARAFLRAADGRELTVRYSRRGAIVGKRSDTFGDHAPLAVQAVTPCEVLELDVDNVLQLMDREASISRAIVMELAARLEDIYQTVGDAVFGSMRQRVARHLLALAEHASGDWASAAVTQQQLADGIGTSRESVTRILSVLRSEGVVRTSPGEIALLDVPRLRSFLGEWRTEDQTVEADLTFEAQRLLEASPNAVIVVDSEGSIVFANSSVERSFGWEPRDLIGRPIDLLVPERTRSVHASHRRTFFEAPEPRPMGLGRALRGLRSDGSEFPLAASLTVIDTRDGPLVVATVVDLSEAGDVAAAGPAG